MDLRVWSVFNAADAPIVLGVATLLLGALRLGAGRRAAVGDQEKGNVFQALVYDI